MIKFKHLLCTAIVGTLLYACGSDSNSPVDNFDHEAQAIIDNDSLVSFLKKHYYDADVDSIKPLISGKVALFDDVKLKRQNITETINETSIEYKLYYYVANQGEVSKGSPTVVDSIFVNYSGQRIVNTDSLSTTFDSNKAVWFTPGGALVVQNDGREVVNSTIRGWAYGYTNFSPGNNITDNSPLTYENFGKGVLFIPSGLGYQNIGSGSSILPNESLMFYIDLLEYVKDTDGDQDGIPSIYEDLDGDGIPWNDNTDEDIRANYIDRDDDGDGVLSKDEDKNGDGNPANDFSDPNKPNVPDYLNRDIF